MWKERHVQRNLGHLPVYHAYIYPCMAFIKINAVDSEGNESEEYCAGSIISSLLILTAAHCLIDPRQVEVSISSINRMQALKLGPRRWHVNPALN
ncbi:hypothetical protein B4U79_19189, partial [Dinothrombium tinctorium]